MLIGQKNSKKQGDVGLAIAISWFAINTNTVCIPLSDSQSYDLIIEQNSILKKVQVKTTKYKRKNRNCYTVHLRTCGGNRSGTGIVKKFNNKLVDFVFIVTENNDKYLIPSLDIKSKNSLVLCNKYDKYKVK